MKYEKLKKNYVTFSLVTLCSILASCETTNTTEVLYPDCEDVRVSTRAKLIRLEAGMNKSQVLDLLGSGSVRAWCSGSLSNYNFPHRSESYRTSGGRVEVLQYYTDLRSSDGIITDDELTPVVLIDGEVDGWGWRYWKNVALRYEIRYK